MKNLLLIAVLAVSTLTSCEKCIEEPKDEPCASIYDPVCSLDGVTYANECEAQKAGVKSWSKGACIK